MIQAVLRLLARGSELVLNEADDLEITTLVYFLEHYGFVTIDDDGVEGLVSVSRTKTFSPTTVYSMYTDLDVRNIRREMTSDTTAVLLQDVPMKEIEHLPGASFGASLSLPSGLTPNPRGKDVEQVVMDQRGDTTHYIYASPKEFVVWVEDKKGSTIAAVYGVPVLRGMLRGRA